MKTLPIRLFRHAGLVLTLLLMLAGTTTAHAQYSAIGFDGDSASRTIACGTRVIEGISYIVLDWEAWITRVRVSIGGTVVSDRQMPDGWRDQGGVFAIHWASTHFPDGSSVEIKAEVWGKKELWGDFGTYYDTDYHSTSYTVQAHNKGMVLGNTGDLAYGVFLSTEVTEDKQAVNYTTNTSTSKRANQIIADLPTYTALYGYSHGNESCFGDCLATPSSPSDYYVTTAQIQTALTSQDPRTPYNVVHLDTCLSAATSSLATAFGIGGVNRALVGWETAELDTLTAAQWTEWMWAKLRAGYSVGEAAASAVAVIGNPDRDSPGDGLARHRIWGDAATKLSSVYGGAPGEWFLGG